MIVDAGSGVHQSATPLEAPKEPRVRTALVNALRGWALLSVVLVNYSLFYSFDAVIPIPSSDHTGRVLKLRIQIFFQTKGWTLLSLLFGYGFAAMTSSRAGMPGPPLTFLRRMFWLGVIALVNSSMYYGDILRDYVVLGLLISLFYRARKNTFLWLALSCFLLFPLFMVTT